MAEPAPMPPSRLRPVRATTRLGRAAIVAVPIALILITALVLRSPDAPAQPSADPSPITNPTATGQSASPPRPSQPSPEPVALPSFAAPGRVDVPWQPGTASHAIVVVDASTVDAATAAWIRASLVDLVHQLPKYDFLTVLAASDAVRIVVDDVELDGSDRDAAIGAIEKLEFGGTRRLVPGVQAAVQRAVKVGPGSYDVLFIATGTDGTTIDQLAGAERAPADANGSSNVGVDFHAVAVGSGEHEALMDRWGDTYMWAQSGADLPLAMTPFRLEISEGQLLGIGPLPGDGESATVLGGPYHFGVRFTAWSPGRMVGFEVVAPDGRVIDVNSNAEEVSVDEFGDRVSIVVNGADAGEWQMRFHGNAEPAADAWYEAEETLSLTYSLVTAYGTGDTTNELKLGVGLPEGATYSASARIVAADGTEQTVALKTLNQDDLNIGGAIEVVGAIVAKPEQAGSYRIYLDADYTDGTGTRHVEGWLLGAYVAPVRDSDGDGITDTVEEQNNFDPHDAADGAADHDHDGLTSARELVELKTSPVEWDTDGGGESDGSEVEAGRHPLDPKDDVPAKTCAQMIPTPAPGATPTPAPVGSAPPAPELEALLPDDILGHKTEKVSMTAPKELTYIFAAFDAFLACTDTTREDLSLAIAVASELNNWTVTAVRIDGVTGQEMADIWMYRLVVGPTGGLFQERTVDGRTYWLSEVGWAVYATDETFYLIASLGYGYAPSPSGSPAPQPSGLEIVEAIIRKLPLDR